MGRKSNVHVVCRVFTARPGVGHPLASVCRPPEDPHSSACGRRWPVVRRRVFQSSHQVGPEISNRTVIPVIQSISPTY